MQSKPLLHFDCTQNWMNWIIQLKARKQTDNVNSNHQGKVNVKYIVGTIEPILQCCKAIKKKKQMSVKNQLWICAYGFNRRDETIKKHCWGFCLTKAMNNNLPIDHRLWNPSLNDQNVSPTGCVLYRCLVKHSLAQKTLVCSYEKPFCLFPSTRDVKNSCALYHTRNMKWHLMLVMRNMGENKMYALEYLKS